MNRRLIDLGEAVAKIEPADNGMPYVTLFRVDEGETKSLTLDCDADQLELFAFALEAAIAEYRRESGS